MTDLVVLIPLRNERASDVRERVARALDRGGLIGRYEIHAAAAPPTHPMPVAAEHEERFEP